MSTVYETLESYECPKCLGKGHIYGFSHVAGGVCFTCNGSRYVFTRRGRHDYDAWRAAVDALVIRPVTDLTPGCSVQLPGFSRYYQVATIEGPIALSYGSIVNGELVPAQGYRLTFTRPVAISTPVGVINETTWEVCSPTVRIHPGQGNMPTAESFDSRRRAA